MELNVKSFDNENIATTWEIKVDAQQSSDVQEEVLTYIRKEAEIPGFRKGKVPVSLIKKKFGDILISRYLELIVSEAYQNILKSNKWVAGDPSINLITKPENLLSSGDFLFEIKLFGPPVVEISEYTNLKIPKVVYEFAKEDINNEIERLQKQKADYIEQEDGIVKKGHFVTINYNFYLLAKDDENEENTRLEIGGKDTKFKNIEKFIIGMKLHEENDFPVKIPAWVNNESLKDKEGKVYIKVIKIEEEQLPKLDDEFAKDLNIDSLEDLKADIKNFLEKECEKRGKHTILENVINQAVEKSKMKIPDALVDKVIENQKRTLAKQLNIPFDEFNRYFVNMESDRRDQWMQEMRADARGNIKRALIIEQIVEKENLYYNEDDLSKKKEEIAKQYKIDIEKIEANIAKNPDFLMQIKDEITNEKLMNFIYENQKYSSTDKKKLTDHNHDHDHDHEHEHAH